MQWILDDGPFDTLADLAEPRNLRRYPPGKLVVAGQTTEDADGSRARVRLLEVETREGDRLVDSFEIFLGGDDPAGEIFLQLLGEEQTTVNRAELESIAWVLAREDRDALFVTADKRAALTALAELGRSRVAHPFDLWIELLDQGAVETEEFQNLCERTKGKDQGLRRMPPRVEVRFHRP